MYGQLRKGTVPRKKPDQASSDNKLRADIKRAEELFDIDMEPRATFRQPPQRGRGSIFGPITFLQVLWTVWVFFVGMFMGMVMSHY